MTFNKAPMKSRIGQSRLDLTAQIKTLERDAAKLESLLANGKILNNREATMALVRQKRMQVGRLKKSMAKLPAEKVSMDGYRKPMRQSNVQRYVPPKGSALHGSKSQRMQGLGHTVNMPTYVDPGSKAAIEAQIKSLETEIQSLSMQIATSVSLEEKAVVRSYLLLSKKELDVYRSMLQKYRKWYDDYKYDSSWTNSEIYATCSEITIEVDSILQNMITEFSAQSAYEAFKNTTIKWLEGYCRAAEIVSNETGFYKQFKVVDDYYLYFKQTYGSPTQALVRAGITGWPNPPEDSRYQGRQQVADGLWSPRANEEVEKFIDSYILWLDTSTGATYKADSTGFVSIPDERRWRATIPKEWNREDVRLHNALENTLQVYNTTEDEELKKQIAEEREMLNKAWAELHESKLYEPVELFALGSYTSQQEAKLARDSARAANSMRRESEDYARKAAALKVKNAELEFKQRELARKTSQDKRLRQMMMSETAASKNRKQMFKEALAKERQYANLRARQAEEENRQAKRMMKQKKAAGLGAIRKYRSNIGQATASKFSRMNENDKESIHESRLIAESKMRRAKMVKENMDLGSVVRSKPTIAPSTKYTRMGSIAISQHMKNSLGSMSKHGHVAQKGINQSKGIIGDYEKGLIQTEAEAKHLVDVALGSNFVRPKPVARQIAAPPTKTGFAGSHPHRPYAMPAHLGMALTQKQRALQQSERPSVTSMDMNELQAYKRAEISAENHAKIAASEQQNQASLAGAFSRTRSVMERLVG